MKNIIFILLLLFSSSVAFSATAERNKQSALARTRELVAEIKKASFPELSETIVQVELFTSESDYFVTRLSLVRFLPGRRINFLLKVNPQVFAFAAPEEGLRAIIAHELGHVVWLKQKNRMQYLGLVRLTGKKFTARFERGTDLLAVARGYADGLSAYRQWLYQHIPPKKLAEKRRNYFSPEEIAALQAELKQHPEKLTKWLKNPPLNRKEITN